MEETTNQRLLELRTEILGLTRKDFGKPVAMSESEVKNIEYNKTTLKEDKLQLICKTYNVRAEWLRDGIGEAKIPDSLSDRVANIAQAAAKNDPEAAARFFKRFVEDFGEANFMLLYEIFRKQFPQYDKPPEDSGE